MAQGGRLSGESYADSSDSQEVVAVAGILRSGRRPNILNSDGQRHPVQNALTVFTLLAGLVSFVLGLIVRNAHTGAAVHITATLTGLAALFVGLYTQMVSATREQRVLIVAGIIAGFVGLAIGLSRGGFTG
jgi:FtsH-binding integral membrane protein